MSKLGPIVLFSLAVILLGGFAFVPAQAADLPSLAGVWQGNLQVSGSEIGLIVRIKAEAGGGYSGTLDVPAQGAKGIPIGKISMDGDQVRIEINLIGGIFAGRLSPDGRSIAGQWQQGGATLPLEMKRNEEAPVLSRPQEPQPPFPYRAEEVKYLNEAAGITLAGTLTIPSGKGPFPAVILITGSGAQDRDETLLGHKPFLVLADYLTRRGLAVLRVDDRGIGGSTGDPRTSTTFDFTSDVLTGVAFLKGRPEIDPKRIGLIGHSEGGLIAPLAATRSQDVSFIVLMAGPGVSGDRIIQLQSELIMRAQGAPEPIIARELALQRKCQVIVKQEPDDAKATAQLREVFAAYIEELTPAEKQQLGNVEAFMQTSIASMLNPWYRTFLSYDPAPTLSKVACPVLALNGEKDLQVPAAQNLPAIEAALKAGGNQDYTVKLLPELNHLFQTCQSGSPAEYGLIEETIAPAALQVMGDWILAR